MFGHSNMAVGPELNVLCRSANNSLVLKDWKTCTVCVTVLQNMVGTSKEIDRWASKCFVEVILYVLIGTFGGFSLLSSGAFLVILLKYYKDCSIQLSWNP